MVRRGWLEGVVLMYQPDYKGCPLTRPALDRQGRSHTYKLEAISEQSLNAKSTTSTLRHSRGGWDQVPSAMGKGGPNEVATQVQLPA